jgi:putative membrane protein
MVVDTTVGVVTQLAFVLTGVMLLAIRSSGRAALPVVWGTLAGIGVFIVAIAIFLLLQHRSLFATSAKLTRGLLPATWLSGFSISASAIDEAVVATYRGGFAFSRANLLRLVGWAAGAGEIWLVMQALGQPFGAVDSFVLESLGSGVRAAAFMVPGAIGALEGGFVLFGALFGLPPETALAISLSKRIRELALGLPGLFVWHWTEGRYLLRDRRKAPP